jgi:hypothetical protein
MKFIIHLWEVTVQPRGSAMVATRARARVRLGTPGTAAETAAREVVEKS